MFSFATARPRRRPGLTPMIDVVFLLLVFFMLAAQFGADKAMPLGRAGSGAYTGPPRLIEVLETGVALNGTLMTIEAATTALEPLVETPADAVILRAGGAATVQDLSRVISALSAAGFTNLVIAE